MVIISKQIQTQLQTLVEQYLPRCRDEEKRDCGVWWIIESDRVNVWKQMKNYGWGCSTMVCDYFYNRPDPVFAEECV